jgi:hypothetical protein
MLSGRVFLRLFLLLLVAGCAVCWGALLYPSVLARYLLYQLKDIHTGHSTFEDAQMFAEKIRATSLGECTHTECRWYRSTDNALLPEWYRGTGVTFTILFRVKDSIVVDKGVQYSVGVEPSTLGEAIFGRSSVYVSESESWFKWQPTKQRGLHNRFPEKLADYVEPPVDEHWEKLWYDANGHVAVDSYAVDISPRSTTILKDWKRYTTFKYSCFWKYRGCGHAKDLLPIIGPYPAHPPS